MEPITPGQFLENAKTWKPSEHFKHHLEHQLKMVQVPEILISSFVEAFYQCAQSTYDYIQYIHELSTTKEIDKQNFLPQVAHLISLVHSLQRAGNLYQSIFKKFDETFREGLTRDEFDTVYYDAIQNMELRSLLKKIIDEVEVVLQTFSLVSQDLKGIECVDLYETSIRFQLFLQYFMAKHKFSSEELWSILFDVYSQVSEFEKAATDPTKEELEELHQKIQKFRNN